MASKRRLLIVILLFSCIGGYVGFRLFELQVQDHDYWQALAQGQQNIFEHVQEERGRIYFADMTPLAINRDFPLIYANPQEVELKDDTARALADILGGTKEEFLGELSRDSLFVTLRRSASEEEAEAVMNHQLPGIYVKEERRRYYPHRVMASRVIGFLGGEGRGSYGVEGYYEKILKGDESFLQKEKGPGGYLVSRIVDTRQGADLVLTLDYHLQFRAEQLLTQAHEDFQIEGGEIIVMDPRSGRILAMAISPSFDVNRYNLVDDFERYTNPSAQSLFEPGSTFKVITMAAALDEGLITPATTYEDTGSVRVGGYTLRNYDGRIWREQTMTEVLEKSINTGAVHVQQLFNKGEFLEYVKRFGFFERTDTDIQGEIFSRNAELQRGYEANLATASYGQGIEVTSMQMLRAFGAIANGGTLYRPHVVGAVIENGNRIENEPHVQKEGVLSQKASAQITAMLTSTVETGFSRRAKIPGYHLAGKTGTAQVPWGNIGVDREGYSDKTIQSFMGYGPAFDPQFLIFVKLRDPQTRTAEYSAVPLFREMAKYVIDYWQIPPDYDPS